MTLAGKIFTYSVKAIIVAMWLLVLYVIVDLIGQQMDFARAIGGLW